MVLRGPVRCLHPARGPTRNKVLRWGMIRIGLLLLVVEAMIPLRGLFSRRCLGDDGDDGPMPNGEADVVVVAKDRGGVGGPRAAVELLPA